MQIYSNMTRLRLINNKCKKCGKLCKNSKGLSQHVGKAHNLKFRKHHCLKCNKRYLSVHALKLHTEQVHGLSKRVVCYLCGELLYNKYYSKKHFIKYHKDESQLNFNQ